MSKKFKIVLHIGTEKTGTTTLQKVMLDNKKHLLKDGVCYLHGEKLINSRDIAAACVGDNVRDDYLDSLGISSPEDRQEFRGKINDKLVKEIEKLPKSAHTLLISSEHFHSRLHKPFMIQYLKDLLDTYAKSFKVVCYIRRQVDMVVSLYSTILKGGGVETFEGLAKRMLKVENHYCNYDTFLSKWEEVFPKECISVKKFERSALVGGSIVDDFLAETGISSSCIVEKTESTNESITHLGQVLLREVNAYSKPSNKTGAKEQNRIRRMIAESFPGKGRQLPPGEAKRLQALFAESNEAVRVRWFPERDVLFENDFPESVRRDLSADQEDVISKIFTYVSSGGEKINDFSKYDDCVEALKEAARIMENNNNIDKSFRLMLLAKEIRPDGPVINSRLKEIESKLLSDK